MRRLLIVSGVVAGLLGVSVALLYLLVDVNQFRPVIQADLQKQLHRTVALGTMSLGLFPLAIRADDVVIGENAAYPTGRPFVSAKQIRVRAELLPLFRKEVRVDSVAVIQPAIELVQNPAGQWNYSDLTSQPSSGTQPVSLSLLQVEDGALVVSEIGKPVSRAIYDHVTLELQDFAPGKKYHFNASAQLPGGNAESFRFEGQGAPFEGRLTLTGAPLAGLARFSGSALPVDGQISGTAELHTAGDASTANLKFELKNPVSHGKPLGFPLSLTGSVQQDNQNEIARFSGSLQSGKVPIGISGETNSKARTMQLAVRIQSASLAEVLGVARLTGTGHLSGSGVLSLDLDVRGPLSGPLTYSGGGALQDVELLSPGLLKPLKVQTATLRFNRNTAAVSNLTAGFAGSTAKGSVTVVNFGSPQLAFDLDVDKVDVEEMQKAIAPAAGKSPGNTSAASLPLTAKGSLRVGTLTSQGLSLTNLRAECAFDKGVLAFSPLSAQLFGGSQTGSLRVDTGHQPAAVELDLKLAGVDVNQLLAAVSSVRNTLFGSLSATGDLHLMLGVPDIARSLNGKLNLNLVKGRWAGTNVLNELGTIGKFAGLSLNGQNVTNISQMGGDIGIVNGLASTSNLQMVMEGGTLAAAGTANLVDQALNLKVTAVLDKTVSRQAGGTGIGGYLTTALSNNQGELVIPANVTGTFASPHFSPDAARLAEMKLKNLLPSVLGSGGGRGLLDALTGKKPPADPAPGEKPKDAQGEAVQGIIDLFRKKR